MKDSTAGPPCIGSMRPIYSDLLSKGDARAYYHGVAEEGVPFRQIAEVIGRLLNVPVVGKASDEALFFAFTVFSLVQTTIRSASRAIQTGSECGEPSDKSVARCAKLA